MVKQEIVLDKNKLYVFDSLLSIERYKSAALGYYSEEEREKRRMNKIEPVLQKEGLVMYDGFRAECNKKIEQGRNKRIEELKQRVPLDMFSRYILILYEDANKEYLQKLQKEIKHAIPRNYKNLTEVLILDALKIKPEGMEIRTTEGIGLIIKI